MKYHWQWITERQVALFAEDTEWDGSLPALGAVVAINQLGLGLGQAAAVYRATGGLMDQAQDFGIFQDAMRAVEAIVKAGGGTMVVGA
jgi:hypothetical protein